MDQSDDNNSSDENSQGTRSGVVTGSGLRPRPWNVTATESQDETRSLLLPEQEPFPRYMTSSPSKYTHTCLYLPILLIHHLYISVPSAQIRLDHSPKDRWGIFKLRAKYYLPILTWLPHYNHRLLLGDLIAGLTLACLLVPQGLSYATALCKLDAIHGLYAIVFPAITYAVFGMSRYDYIYHKH